MSTAHVGLVAFQTILGKEIRRFSRIWQQTILPPAITMSLYLVIFGNLIGTRVGEMGGYPYMDYIAPGVIMMAVITSSYSNVVSSFFGARYQRYVEEMLISPTPHAVILLGYVGGGVARGLAVGLVVTTVAMLLADLDLHNPLITGLIVFLTSVLFALAGFINAMYAKNFDDIAIVPTFVLTPLIYLGGVFYSIQLLPEPWQTLSRFNPILYMVNGFRYGILGVSDIPVLGALAAIALFVVILFLFSLRLLNKGVGIRT
jgi:ABC-2 type transport system permease protein